MDDAILDGPARRREGGRARVTPALLVMLMVAAVCPFVSSSPAAAAGGGEIIELPSDFIPQAINDSGQIAGMYAPNGVGISLAIWEDGNLVTIPPERSGNGVYSFNDRGEIATKYFQNGFGKLAIVTAEETTYLELPPITGGPDTTPFPRSAFVGWGPAATNSFVATTGWDAGLKTGTWVWDGVNSFSPTTSVTTAQALSDSGLLFGEFPATYPNAQYGVVDLVTGETNVVAVGSQNNRTTAIDFGDGGHLVYSNADGTFLWSSQERVTLDVDFGPRRVNGKGDVVGMLRRPNNESVIRRVDGSYVTLKELAGDTTGWGNLNDPRDINDNCDVIGYDVTAAGVRTPFLIRGNGCETVDIEGDFFRVDGGSPFVKVGDDAQVRLRVDNSSGKELTNVRVTSAQVVAGADGGAATLGAPAGAPPSTLAASGPGSIGFADYELRGDEPGTVTLRAQVAAIKEGVAITGTIEREFTVRQDDLVVNLTLDPPEYEVPDDGVFEPTDITATVSFTNATNEPMTNLRLQDLDVARVFSGQELYVTYTSGIRPDPLDPEVIVPSLPAGATSPEFQAVFTATDSGEVEFSALATAQLGESGAAVGLTKVRWKAKVQKFVEITTEVVSPPDGELIDAGSPVTINGTVENLSNAHRVTLGPLYPQLAGNTGTMNVGYDGNAANPTSPVPAEKMVLEPGQKRTFQVRFTTNYSDPRMYEAQPSGGTRAYATFEPWGEAVEVRDPDDGEPEVVQIRTYDEATPPNGSASGPEPDAQVLATPDALFQRISIDDSIELPPFDRRLFAAGIIRGAAEGSVNAAIAAIAAIPDLVKLPYTVMVAAYDYQTKVWASFTEEEKEQFLTETSFLIVSVLQRNVEFGLRDSKELYDEVYKMAGDHLTQTENDWAIGDYEATTQGYAAFLSETIGSVAGPVILSKMAKSPKAVAALERYQTAINARMAATFASAKNVRYVDNVLPILQSIENGAEPTLTAIAKLWGVTPEEIAEYQRICGIIGCLANIRSRHVSSIEWIKKFNALLKPESLKIKTVSDLDVMLGYDFADLGSVVFKKPEILTTVGSGATKDQISAEARRFAASKGFKADTKEFTEAVARLEDKVKEWNKYEKTYKQWDQRGWIDTTFNYEGNAIPEYLFDADGNVIHALTGADKGNFKGFRMVEKSPGSEEYVVQMLDGKTGKFRRITGDIDPVDFTYTDGSPLSPEDHAILIQLLQDSPIGAEHGYTSTFKGFKDPKTGAVIVDPGPELVKAQFKPNEPALQIAPTGAPRATRIDVENSRWVNPYDYNIRWVNGFVDAGSGRGRGPASAVDINFDVIPLDAPKQVALPLKSKPDDPTVGRFIIKHGNKGDSAALIMGENGLIQKVLPDGTTEPSELHDQAFSEGDTRTITLAPATTLTGPAPSPDALLRDQALANPSGTGRFGLARPTATGTVAATASYAAAAAVSAQGEPSLLGGSTLIGVSTEAGLAGLDAAGFIAGQTLALGVGSPTMELVEVASTQGDQVTLVEPLTRTHSPGEVIVMVVSADGVPVNPDAGPDPVDPGTVPPDPTDPPGPTDPGTTPTDPSDPGAPASAGTPVPASVESLNVTSAGTSGNGAGSTGQPLALTGSNSLLLVMVGLLAVMLGVWLDRRRRRVACGSSGSHGL